MPLTLETAPPAPINLSERRRQRGAVSDRFRRLRIGLVNNMPDAAVKAAERQFSSLIEDASGDYDVRLTLIALETLPRAEDTRAAMRSTYRDPAQARHAGLDAIIFTGAEPRSPDLAAEPFWDELTALIDWARGALVSTLYSCLAAHAAALHGDGLQRRRLGAKLSGVFAGEVVAGHELTEGLTAVLTPHSRYNGLSEPDLIAHGYQIVTRSDEAGADMFVREGRVLEVFWQGHPEYEADTLAREFRRDMLDYFNRQGSRRPSPPVHYFGPEAEARIAAAMEAAKDGEASLGEALNPEALNLGPAAWRESSAHIMRNWLKTIAARKARTAMEGFARVRAGG